VVEDIMTDPWDDAGRSQAGFVVTGAGLRVPVAAPTAFGGWPATAGPAAAAVPAGGAPAAFRGVGPKGYQRSDAYVKERVCERLLLDPYLDASDITVKVSRGRIALKGRVPSERMRAAAIAAASSVATGAVEDGLQVPSAPGAKPSRRPVKTSRARVASKRRRRGPK
jgi:BON domain